MNRGAARFDMEKLQSLNGRYIRESSVSELLADIEQRLAARHPAAATDEGRRRIAALLPEAKARAKTLVELADNLSFLVSARPLAMTPKAARLLGERGSEARARLGRLKAVLQDDAAWDEAALEDAVRGLAEDEDIKLGSIAQPLRAALTGSHASPGIFAVMVALGPDETLARLGDAASATMPDSDGESASSAGAGG